MERDSYTLLELILGLRDKYLKNEEILKELKDYCAIHDGIINKLVEDFDFYVIHYHQQNPDLFCNFVRKYKKLRYLIHLLITLNVYGNSAICTKDNNDNYFFEEFSRYHYPIYVNKKKEFANKVSEMFDSEFINSIKKEILINGDDSISIRIEHSHIHLWNASHIYINYYPKLDRIVVDRYDDDNNKLSDQLIYNSLNAQISSKKLPSYHINAINDSRIFEKNIVLEKVGICKEAEFSIQEQDKQIVLTKVKVR